jgi:3-hydroxyisobutyrate dehydrogenase
MAKVTFLGLGVMGYPMARHIAKAGHDVTVYNRTTAKAEKWVKEFGGKFAKTPKDASKDSDFIFCCVGNDNDLKEVTLGSEGAFRIFRCASVWRTSWCRKWPINSYDWWRK